MIWALTQACKSVDTIDVHSAASADTLSATPSECEGGVDFVLDPDQGIQHHWAGLLQIKGIALHPWLGGWLIWVPSVDVECLDLGIWVRSRFLNSARLRRRYNSRRRRRRHRGHCPHLRLEGWSCRREEARGVAKSCHGGVEGGVCGQLSSSLTPMTQSNIVSETVDSMAQMRSLGYTQWRRRCSCVVVVDGKTFDLGNK